MNNNPAYWFIGALWLVLLVTLSIKLGFQKAILISFFLIVWVPQEVYGFLLGLILFSVNMALTEWMFKYWPVTLILGLCALLGHLSHQDTVTKPKE